jgi:hypothetical protein
MYISFNRAKGVKQEFSKKDRSVSPVTFDSANNSKSLLLVGEYIDQLRLKLAVVMNRPTMTDINLGHESYFSRSLPGMCDGHTIKDGNLFMDDEALKKQHIYVYVVYIYI